MRDPANLSRNSISFQTFLYHRYYVLSRSTIFLPNRYRFRADSSGSVSSGSAPREESSLGISSASRRDTGALIIKIKFCAVQAIVRAIASLHMCVIVRLLCTCTYVCLYVYIYIHMYRTKCTYEGVYIYVCGYVYICIRNVYVHRGGGHVCNSYKGKRFRTITSSDKGG